MKHLHCLLYSLIVFTFISCGKDDNDPETPPEVINEEELITTVTINFYDPDGILPSSSFTFRDADGPGGNDPTSFDTIRLAAFESYEASILLLNEATEPDENITDEIEDEAADHIFCYIPSGVAIDIDRTDSDGVYELGVTSAWTTNETGTGTVTVVLKHQPGIKDGTCGPGETDVEIIFPVVIE